MLLWKCAEEAPSQAPVGMSIECFGGDVGRSLVAVDHPRHDGARIADLQGIPRIRRRNRDQYIGRSPAEAGRSWNCDHGTRLIGRTKADLLAHRERNRSRTGAHGNGSLGSRARRYRQSSAGPANAGGQGTISGRSSTTLGAAPFPPNLTWLGICAVFAPIRKLCRGLFIVPPSSEPAFWVRNLLSCRPHPFVF